MRQRIVVVLVAFLTAVAGAALVARSRSPGGALWRARLDSLLGDRDADLRDDLLQRPGLDPFALRRLELTARSTGGDAQAWRDFTSAAAAPRPDWERIDRAVAALDPSRLPPGAANAYGYLHLWCAWQRNRPGNALAALEALERDGLPAARAARALGEAAGEQGTVQLAIPGLLRAAAADAGPTAFHLRRLFPVATRRLAIRLLAAEAPPAERSELARLSVADTVFATFSLAGDQIEIATPTASVRGPVPWPSAPDQPRLLLWDAATGEAIARGPRGELRAPGAVAPLEPLAEIEVRFASPGLVRDLVIAAAPRGATLPAAR